MLHDYSNIHVVVDEAVEKTLFGKKFLFLPWLNPKNTERLMGAVKQSRADVLCSHLQLKGFVMHRGSVAMHGMDKKDFAHFNRVWSGHFHSPSINGNVHYLGSPYETSWADYGDVKGFHIYTPEQDTLEMIINPFGLHLRINYRDGMTRDDIPDVAGRYIIVDVLQKDDVAAFRDFVTAIYDMKPADVKFNEEHKTINAKKAETISIEDFESTSKMMQRYISETVQSSADKVSQRMQKYYDEAIRNV